MREYLLKRVLLIVPTLFLVTILVFLLMRMRSGDVVIQMLDGYAYADTVEALRRELGLDKPLYEQYLAWMGGVLRGDLGRSLWTKEPILLEFARRFPVTLELTLLTIIISVTFGVGVGVGDHGGLDQPFLGGGGAAGLCAVGRQHRHVARRRRAGEKGPRSQVAQTRAKK